MKQAIIGLLVIAVVGGVIYFAGSKGYTPAAQPPTSSVSSTSSTASSSEASSMTSDVNVKVINVEAGSFYYKPNVIEVTKGQKVKVVLTAVSMMHDFNIDELGVKLPIVKNGDTGTVEFTADKMGTFEYYCSVGQHRANGQVGKITVK